MNDCLSTADVDIAWPGALCNSPGTSLLSQLLQELSICPSDLSERLSQSLFMAKFHYADFPGRESRRNGIWALGLLSGPRTLYLQAASRCECPPHNDLIFQYLPVPYRIVPHP